MQEAVSMTTELIKDTKQRMQKTVDAYQRELGSIRAGRANASIEWCGHYAI